MSSEGRRPHWRQTFGADVRQPHWTPTDTARAEGLVAEYGGVVSLTSGESAGVCVEWLDASGCRVMLEGRDAPAVLRSLSAVLRERRLTRGEASFFSSFQT
jgi:hypothetical protein